ncbi:MAG TPA: efflux RND transporter periplasmic adaptor subunit [Flavisolibacter sp.]|nr:efflux RND transporter periplasmic adaptor subunit [Flavisolibacter sp.]
MYFLVFALFSLSILITSCSSKRKKEAAAQQRAAGAKPPTPKVDLFVVQTQTVSETLEVPGTIVSEDATEIHPEVAGRIVNLNVREGQQVGKGAVLAKLYDGDLQAQKRKLQVQLQIAQQTESRHEQLLKIGGISKEDYAATALQVSNLRADLDIINTSIAKTVIRAPFSGKLGLKDISTGAYVTPSSVIAMIQKTNDLKIDFNLPEKYTSQVRKGQYVNFTIEGTDRNYSAVIAATDAGIEQTTRTLMFRAAVKGDLTGLTPGNFAKVKLSFDPNPNALLIPSQAIIPQARGKKVVLFKGGVAEFKDVTTGVRDSTMVQITDGLNKGDSVVITGLLAVKPQGKIAVNKIVNQPR